VMKLQTSTACPLDGREQISPSTTTTAVAALLRRLRMRHRRRRRRARWRRWRHPLQPALRCPPRAPSLPPTTHLPRSFLTSAPSFLAPVAGRACVY
jgi:hypothetical protein